MADVTIPGRAYDPDLVRRIREGARVVDEDGLALELRPVPDDDREHVLDPRCLAYSRAKIAARGTAPAKTFLEERRGLGKPAQRYDEGTAAYRLELADLHGRYPRLTVELFTGNADAVEEKLAHGLIDFALMIEPFNTEHYHFIRLPEPMRVGIVTRDDSEWAAKDGVTAEDLSEMPLLISSRQSSNRFDFRQWSDGKLSAETMHIVGHFDLISNASHFIRTGIANAIGIDELLQLDTGHLKFIPLKPALTFSAVIVWKKYRLLSKSSSVFLEELRKRMTQ